MNRGQVNGFNLNDSTLGGNNATLQGGFVSTGLFTSLLIASALLQGGISNKLNMGGTYNCSLTGGVECIDIAGGTLFNTANLQGSVYGSSEIDSHLGIASGLNGGCISDGFIEGNVIGNAKLQMPERTGDTCYLNAGMTRSDGLYSGITATSYTSGLLVGSAVLMADGVKSNSDIGGVIQNGFTYSGGTDSYSLVGANYFITVSLSDGIVSHSLVGKELDIDARLQGGMVNVGDVGSPTMRIGAKVANGVSSNCELDSAIILSPYSNGGVATNSSVIGNWCLDAVLTSGLYSTNIANSIALKATQRMGGGISSISATTAKYTISPHMNFGAYSASNTSSNYCIDAVRSGGCNSTSGIGAKVFTRARLQDGISSTSEVTSKLLASGFLTQGLSSTCALGGERTAVSLLTNGIASNSIVFGDVVQGFVDPLLNTWALSILSATPILSISTPIRDN